jgi:protein TonB
MPTPRALFHRHEGRSARLLGAGFVVLFHIAFVYALVTSLAHRTVDVVRAPVETRIIDEAREQTPEPPPPPPEFTPPPVAFVPPPEVHVELPPPPPKSNAITVVAPVRPVPTPVPPAPAPAAEPVRAMPRIDASHSREPEYPPTSRRLGEEGSLIVQVLVDTNGRVTDAKLVQSSGFDRLDQAALEGVKGNYRFVPGTVDGKPAPMWFTFRFTWKLR